MIANKKENITYILFITLMLITIGLRVKLQGFADDLYFTHALDGWKFSDYVFARYRTWSGRLVLDGLMLSTINIHPVWRVGIPLSVLVLCISISKLAAGKVDLKLVALSLCAYLLIPKDILDNSSWWITGFYNYLLPVSAMLYSLSVLVRSYRHNVISKMAAIACLALSCFNEQTAIFTVIAAIVMLALNRKLRDIFGYFYIAVSVAFSLILFMAPGNIKRFGIESWRWFPEFQHEHLMYKVLLGIDRLHGALVTHNALNLCALSVLSIILIRRQGYKGVAQSAVTLILAAQVIIFFALRIKLFKLGFSFYNENFLNTEMATSYSRYLSYFMSMMIMVSVCYSLAVSSIKDSSFLVPLCAIIISCATVVMIGFSPTVYASGMRVLFLCEVIISSSCVFIFYKIYGSEGNASRYVTAFAVVMCLLNFSI